jgi:hypothetical protein
MHAVAMAYQQQADQTRQCRAWRPGGDRRARAARLAGVKGGRYGVEIHKVGVDFLSPLVCHKYQNAVNHVGLKSGKAEKA